MSSANRSSVRVVTRYSRPMIVITGASLRSNDSYGLLMLTLRDAAFDRRTVSAAWSSLVDAGTAARH